MEIKQLIRKQIIKILNEGIFETDNTIKKYEKLMINSIVEFMKDKFNFNANIIVKKKQSTNFFGDIALNYNSINNNKFTMHFNPNAGYKKIIKSLIHELTHIKQVSKKELRPAPDYKSILWKDEFSLPVRDYNKIIKNFENYAKLPWEAEAYKNMNDDSLLNEFFNSDYWKNLKGKDANLDFIIDNI